MLESPMPYKYENTPVAYSTGNYGVRHHYTITINNTGDARKLKYVISTVSHVIGIDLDSSLKDRNVFIKGETLPSDEKYDLLEWDVPGHQSTTYEFVVLLPTGDAGRIVNLLKIDN